MHSDTSVHEIAAGIYRIATPIRFPNGAEFSYNQYLVGGRLAHERVELALGEGVELLPLDVDQAQVPHRFPPCRAETPLSSKIVGRRTPESTRGLPGAQGRQDGSKAESERGRRGPPRHSVAVRPSDPGLSAALGDARMSIPSRPARL